MVLYNTGKETPNLSMTRFLTIASLKTNLLALNVSLKATKGGQKSSGKVENKLHNI
jgi:hypothetical protein